MHSLLPADANFMVVDQNRTGAHQVLSDPEVLTLFRVAREAMAAKLMHPIGNMPAIEYSTPIVVNVTIRNNGQLRGSMRGQGATILEAVSLAAWRAAGDQRFRPLSSLTDVMQADVEIWIQRTRKIIAPEGAMTLDLGREGVELWSRGSFAYYKPSVALTSGVTSPVQLFRNLSRKAGLTASAWYHARATLNRTTWQHYVERCSEQGLALLRLCRLRPVHEPRVTAEEVLKRVHLAEDRLTAVQSSNGLYLYKYHPFTQESSGGEVNIVRQAGCTYGIAAAAAKEQDLQRAAYLEQSAVRSIDFLLTFASSSPNGGLYITQPQKIRQNQHCKLGTLALFLLALQYGRFPQKYHRERSALIATILSFQNENGSFRVYADQSVAYTGTLIDYFPGQALLALAREAQRGSDVCRNAVVRAFSWYRRHFQRTPATAFILWQVDTWRLAFEWPKDSGSQRSVDPGTYADFVFEMADWLLQFQLRENAKPKDFCGGFSRPGSSPSYSTAVFAEAIIRAYGVARVLGNSERMARYRESSLLALRFLFRLQIAPETAFLFRHPDRAIGGTPRSLHDFTIRSDFDQHLITAFLAALETPGLLETRDPAFVAQGVPLGLHCRIHRTLEM